MPTGQDGVDPRVQSRGLTQLPDPLELGGYTPNHLELRGPGPAEREEPGPADRIHWIHMGKSIRPDGRGFLPQTIHGTGIISQCIQGKPCLKGNQGFVRSMVLGRFRLGTSGYQLWW